MTPEQITAILALCDEIEAADAAATKGPWRVVVYRGRDFSGVRIGVDTKDEVICNIATHNDFLKVEQEKKEATLIADYRTAAPSWRGWSGRC